MVLHPTWQVYCNFGQSVACTHVNVVFLVETLSGISAGTLVILSKTLEKSLAASASLSSGRLLARRLLFREYAMGDKEGPESESLTPLWCDQTD